MRKRLVIRLRRKKKKLKSILTLVCSTKMVCVSSQARMVLLTKRWAAPTISFVARDDESVI